MNPTVTRWGGNRYRVRCIRCRWAGQFIAKSDWEDHPHRHFIPADQPDTKPSIVPGPFKKDKKDEEPKVEEPKNHFLCPNEECQADHRGYPESCDNCGQTYNWDN